MRRSLRLSPGWDVYAYVTQRRWLGILGGGLLAAGVATSVVALGGPRATPPRAEATRETKPLVVGYFGQWSLYEKFWPQKLVASGAAAELDQINYAQGFVTGGHCSVADPLADVTQVFEPQNSVDGQGDRPDAPLRGNFNQLRKLKRRYPRMKVLLSLEGKAADFAADAQPGVREAFVRSCVDLFLRGHVAPGVEAGRLFDGIDLDWEYPEPEDAANFLALLEEFRRQMRTVRPGLRLSIAVSVSPRHYRAEDVPRISELVDEVGVMNYDYSGPWSPRTGLLAPLHAPDGAHGGTVEESLEAWADAGVPRSKLLMGLPFYGYGWHGVAPAQNGLYQAGKAIRGDRPYSFFEALLRPPVAGTETASGEPGKALPERAREAAAPALTGSSPAPAVPTGGVALPPVVRAAPLLLYRDPRSAAPWLYDGDTFWTFEDPQSIRTKARYAREQGLGGVMAWELSEDASDGRLLHAAAEGLRQRSGSGGRELRGAD